MLKYIVVFVLIFALTHLSNGQEIGCFSRDGNSDLVLKIDSQNTFNKHERFIVGEFHDYKQVPEIKLALIKYLHEKCGVDDLFMEIGMGAAYLYNRYLETGDTDFISQPALVYASTKEGKLFWEKLADYNKLQAKKLVVHGIDFERMEFLKALRVIGDGRAGRPAGIRDMLYYIDTVKVEKVNDKALVKVYNRIKEQFDLHEDDCRKYYSNTYVYAKEMMYNINTYSLYSSRNTNMYINTKQLLKSNGIKKYLLFAGERHCDKSDKESLCGRVIADSILGANTTNIVMLCRGCDTVQDAQQTGFSGPLPYIKDIDLLENLYNSASFSGCYDIILETNSLKNHQISKVSDYLLLMNY